MKTRHLVAVAAVYAAAAAVSAASDRARVLDWDCARAGAPDWTEVEQVYGYADHYRLYHARVVLNQLLKRACKGGEAQVSITAADLDAALELAAR